MLTRSATHAVRAMVALAGLEPGEYAQTARIAEATSIPRNYLAKILFLLSRRGLVESQRGLGGGFRLSRDALAISLYEVIDSVEDVARWKECAFGEKECTESRPCALHHRWGRVRDTYFNLLNNTYVGELLGNRPACELSEPASLNVQRRPL
jgi:Rrf2 family transcriptional regulator, iron-sulfur cluster assembly transcription factor